jgi:hypothetical protein
MSKERYRKMQPARESARIAHGSGVLELVDFAHRRDKRRAKNKAAKAARRKQRK